MDFIGITLPKNAPCPLGYTGYASKCDVPICFGISNDSNLVCNSGSGSCLSPDKCQCLNGFYGLDCTIPFCETNLFNSSSSSFSCPQDGSNPQQQTQTKSEIIPTLQDLGAKWINFTKDENVKAQFPSTFSQYLIEKGLNASEKVTLLSSIYQPIATKESRSEIEAPLVSSVLTISLYDKSGSKIAISELKDPIELTFSNIVIESTSYQDINYSCMYFDENKKEWSLDGLMSEVSNLEITTKTVKFNMNCKTYHLTSFGVIDQNFKRATNPTQSSNGSIDNSATILAIVLSTVGSILAFDCCGGHCIVCAYYEEEASRKTLGILCWLSGLSILYVHGRGLRHIVLIEKYSHLNVNVSKMMLDMFLLNFYEKYSRQLFQFQ